MFCWKNVSTKATHIFSAKNIRILCIESARTVNEMTLNELVKLTRLWTTGPWKISIIFVAFSGATFAFTVFTISIWTYRPESQPRWLSWMRRPTGDRRSRVQPPSKWATFFRGDWSWNIFYGHSFPSALEIDHEIFSMVIFDHEIFSMVILSLLLSQEGQLSVAGERMCTILVNLLEDCLPSKRVVR